jgi:hypothetical protein
MNNKPKIKRTAAKTKPKMGRPPTKHGIYDPPRILGRVSPEDWETIKAAARKHTQQTGENFTEWAVEILMREARKVLTSKN